MQDNWAAKRVNEIGTARALGAWLVACAIATAFGAIFVCLEMRSQPKGSAPLELWTPWAAGQPSGAGSEGLG